MAFVLTIATPLAGHAQLDAQRFCSYATGHEVPKKEELERTGGRLKDLWSNALQDEPEVAKGFAELPDGHLHHSYLRRLAACYLYGSSVEADLEKAKNLFALAADDGDSIAEHRLASLRLFNSKNPLERRKGFEALQRRYEEGSAFAGGQLGWAYAKGLVVEKDYEKAIELFKIAARRGMTYWQFALAHAYEKGYLGLERNEDKAKYWLDYQPKIHIVKYDVLIAAYYEEGFFPVDAELQHVVTFITSYL